MLQFSQILQYIAELAEKNRGEPWSVNISYLDDNTFLMSVLVLKVVAVLYVWVRLKF